MPQHYSCGVCAVLGQGCCTIGPCWDNGVIAGHLRACILEMCKYLIGGCRANTTTHVATCTVVGLNQLRVHLHALHVVGRPVCPGRRHSVNQQISNLPIVNLGRRLPS
eukprot:scaffold109199_cov35-Tisochrysis_lutea.AAC.5